MATQPKKLGMGLALLAGFAVVLVIIFMPVFPGLEAGKKENGLNYLDNLYNTISKGSAYYIPEVQKKVATLQGQQLDLTISFKEARQTEQVAMLLNSAGAQAVAEGTKLKMSGPAEKILLACLADADDMYFNRGEKVAQKYNCPERMALFNWHAALALVGKELTRQGNREGGESGRLKFYQAKMAEEIKTKAVETAYNYYGIQSKNIGQEWLVVLFSLAFYVVYTVWYGYGIMFLFEGAGLNLEH